MVSRDSGLEVIALESDWAGYVGVKTKTNAQEKRCRAPQGQRLDAC